MVKSKKMSKSAIAIIVLSLLLVLSMVMGLTGAWFTAKQDHADVPSESLGFGVVELSESGATSISYDIYEGNTEYTKLVDGDVIHIADNYAVTNQSNVKILYIVEKSLSVTGTGFFADAAGEAALLGWLKDGETALAEQNGAAKGHLAAGAALPTVATYAGDYEVKSNGVANGKNGTFVITVHAKVLAVQEGNLKGDTVADTLANVQAAFDVANGEAYTTLTNQDLVAFGLYTQAEIDG